MNKTTFCASAQMYRPVRPVSIKLTMEKYTRFADPKTGVNPFLPSWVNARQTPLTRLWELLLLPFTIAKFLLTFLGFGVIGATDVALKPLEGVSLGFLRQVFSTILCQWTLRALGFWIVEEKICDHRRLKIAAPTQPHPKRGVTASDVTATDRHGSLIFANFTNFAEILYLHYKLRPTFAFPVKKDGGFCLVGLSEALQYSASFLMLDQHRTEGKLVVPTISDVCRVAREQKLGPVVVFPEGMKSNGTCLLKWHIPPVTKQDLKVLQENVALVTFDYLQERENKNFPRYGAPHTTKSLPSHVVTMCSALCPSFRTVWVTPQQVKSTFATVVLEKDSEAIEHLRKMQQRTVAGLQLAEIDGALLSDFQRYFQQTQNKQYTKMQ